MTDREQFENRVIPIMDRVREDLNRKQAEEFRRFMSSPRYILAGGVGPDGGMGAQAVALDTLNITGEWTSKTVEDYVEMVKTELSKEGIAVSPELEEMMIDKMVHDEMPKSSLDYVLRKAGGNTLFGLVNEMRKSPLQREIEERGEALHNPSGLEKGLGWAIGAAADFSTMGGSSLVGGLKFIGADLAINAIVDTVDKKTQEVPSVALPEYQDEWVETHRDDGVEEEGHQTETVPEEEVIEVEPGPMEVKEDTEEKVMEKKEEEIRKKEEATKGEEAAEPEAQETREEQKPVRDNTGGWQRMLAGLGLNGLGDIGRNAGYILAMLPDMLVGLLTGKTQSLGLKDNLVPFASIMAGLFVKNPLLKMTLIGLGGANLLNKAGHEQLARREGAQQEDQSRVRYRQYEQQPMDPRIRDAEIHGNSLIASIDGIPVSIALPEKVVDAYNSGALPMGTLANAVLARCDQMQQIADARERFELESRTERRGLSQR